MITNLESILLEKKIKPKNLNINNLHAHSNFSDVLNKHNIKNVSLSNNHTFDFNLSGYLQTKKILKEERNKSFWSWEKLIRGKKTFSV